MPIVTLFIYLLILAIGVMLARAMPENAQPIKNIIIWTLAGIAILIILYAFGVIDALNGIRTPRI